MFSQLQVVKNQALLAHDYALEQTRKRLERGRGIERGT